MATTRAFLNELKNFKRQGDVLYDPNVWRYSDTSGWERADFLTPGKWYASANPVDQYGPAPGTYLLSQAEKQEREESEREAQMERARQLINERYGVRTADNPDYAGWVEAGGFLFNPITTRYVYDPETGAGGFQIWQHDYETNSAGWESVNPLSSDDFGTYVRPGFVPAGQLDRGVSAPRSIEEALQRYNRSNFDVGATANYIRQLNSQLGIPEEQLIAAIPVHGQSHINSIGHGYTEGSNYQDIAANAITNALTDMGYSDRAAYVASQLQPFVQQGGADAHNRWQQTQEDNSLWARMVDFGHDITRDTIDKVMSTSSDLLNFTGQTGLARQTDRATENLYGVMEDAKNISIEHPEIVALIAAAVAAPYLAPALGEAAAGAGAAEIASAGTAAEAVAGAAGAGAIDAGITSLVAGAAPSVTTPTILSTIASNIGAPAELVSILSNPLVANGVTSLIRSGVTGQDLDKTLQNLLFSAAGGVIGGAVSSSTQDLGGAISKISGALANYATQTALKGGDINLQDFATKYALGEAGSALKSSTGLGKAPTYADTGTDTGSTTITPASTGEDTDSGVQISQAGDTSVGDDYSDDYLTSLNEDFGGVIDTGGGYDIPAQDLIDIALATGDKSIIDAVNSALLESEAGGVDAGGVDAGGVDAGGVDAGGGDTGGGDTGGGDTGGGPSSGVDSAYGGDTEEGARDVPPASDWKTGAGDELPSGVYNPVTGEWKSTPPGYEPGSYIEQPDGTIVPSGTAFPGLSFKVGKDQNPSDVYKSLVRPGLSDYLKKFTNYVNPAAAIKKLYGAATGTEDPLDALLRAGASGAGIYGLLSLLGKYAKPSSGPTLQPYSGIDMRQYTPTGVGQPNTNVYQPTYTDYQKTPAAAPTEPSEVPSYADLINKFALPPAPPAASTPPTPPAVSAPVTSTMPTTPPTAEPGVSDKSLADTVLEMSVGKIPPDLTWDANGDGKITATDALRVQRGWKPPSYNPSSPAPTTLTTPSTPKPDYGFIPPPEDVATTQAFENWKNKKTGETFTTRHGGYTPPSADWERYDPNPIVSSASNPYGFTGGDGLQMDRVQWRNNKTGQTWSGNSSWNPPSSDWTRSGGEVPQIPESLLTVAPKRIPEDTTSSDAFPLTPPQSSTPFAKAVGLPEPVPPSTPINPAQPQPTGWEGNLGPDDRPLGTVTAAVGGIMSLKDRAGSLQVGDEPWQTGVAWQEEPVRFMAMGGISSLGGYSDGGRLLKGPGDGMSDNIPATIGDKQPARLADGEFVIPADVVSHLGNGSTDAGAKQLYAMMHRIRKARTGNPKQGKQIKPEKYLVA